MIDIHDTLVQFGDNLIDDIAQEMNSQGLVGSNLEQSLKYEIDGKRIVVTAANYLPYAQRGRGRGGVPWDFKNILLNWMQRYNIHANDGDDERFAEAIKWKTIREGSAIWRGVRPERDFVSKPIADNLAWLEKTCLVSITEQFFYDRQK